jgi:hypothetical protein
MLLDHLDCDAKFASGSFEHPADVGVQAEPQLRPEGQARGQGFRDQPARSALPGSDDRSLVQQGPGIEDSEHLGVGMADAVASRGAEPVE